MVSKLKEFLINHRNLEACNSAVASNQTPGGTEHWKQNLELFTNLAKALPDIEFKKSINYNQSFNIVREKKLLQEIGIKESKDEVYLTSFELILITNRQDLINAFSGDYKFVIPNLTAAEVKNCIKSLETGKIKETLILQSNLKIGDLAEQAKPKKKKKKKKPEVALNNKLGSVFYGITDLELMQCVKTAEENDLNLKSRPNVLELMQILREQGYSKICEKISIESPVFKIRQILREKFFNSFFKKAKKTNITTSVPFLEKSFELNISREVGKAITNEMLLLKYEEKNKLIENTLDKSLVRSLTQFILSIKKRPSTLNELLQELNSNCDSNVISKIIPELLKLDIKVPIYLFELLISDQNKLSFAESILAGFIRVYHLNGPQYLFDQLINTHVNTTNNIQVLGLQQSFVQYIIILTIKFPETLHEIKTDISGIIKQKNFAKAYIDIYRRVMYESFQTVKNPREINGADNKKADKDFWEYIKKYKFSFINKVRLLEAWCIVNLEEAFICKKVPESNYFNAALEDTIRIISDQGDKKSQLLMELAGTFPNESDKFAGLISPDTKVSFKIY